MFSFGLDVESFVFALSEFQPPFSFFFFFVPFNFNLKTTMPILFQDNCNLHFIF